MIDSYAYDIEVLPNFFSITIVDVGSYLATFADCVDDKLETFYLKVGTFTFKLTFINKLVVLVLEVVVAYGKLEIVARRIKVVQQQITWFS